MQFCCPPPFFYERSWSTEKHNRFAVSWLANGKRPAEMGINKIQVYTSYSPRWRRRRIECNVVSTNNVDRSTGKNDMYDRPCVTWWSNSTMSRLLPFLKEPISFNSPKRNRNRCTRACKTRLRHHIETEYVAHSKGNIYLPIVQRPIDCQTPAWEFRPRPQRCNALATTFLFHLEVPTFTTAKKTGFAYYTSLVNSMIE